MCTKQTIHLFCPTVQYVVCHRYFLILSVCIYVIAIVFSFKLDGDTQGWLEINAATGEIKTKDKLDRETLEAFEITVIAFEKGKIIQRCYWSVIITATS